MSHKLSPIFNTFIFKFPTQDWGQKFRLKLWIEQRESLLIVTLEVWENDFDWLEVYLLQSINLFVFDILGLKIDWIREVLLHLA